MTKEQFDVLHATVDAAAKEAGDRYAALEDEGTPRDAGRLQYWRGRRDGIAEVSRLLHTVRAITADACDGSDR